MSLYAIAWILGIAGFVGAIWFATRAGRNVERVKDGREELEAVDKANEIERDVNKLSRDELVKRMRYWRRKFLPGGETDSSEGGG